MKILMRMLLLALFATLISGASVGEEEVASAGNSSTDDSSATWKVSERSALWNLMHTNVKSSSWSPVHSIRVSRPDPTYLLNARSVAIITFGTTQSRLYTWWGKPYFLPDGANVIRGREIVETEITRWNQYTLLEDPARADLVLALREWDRDDCPYFCIENYGWTASRLVVLKGGMEFEQKAEAVWAKQIDDIRDDAYLNAVVLICDFRHAVEKLGRSQKGHPRLQAMKQCNEDAYRNAAPYWELPEGTPLRDTMYLPSFSDLHPEVPSYRKVSAQGPELLNAKTVAIILFGHGHPLSSKYYSDPAQLNVLRTKETVEKELKKATHYKVVEDPRAADLVIAVRVWTEEYSSLFWTKHYYDSARLAVFKGGAAFDQTPEILWADEGNDYGMIHWFCKDLNKLQNAEARK